MPARQPRAGAAARRAAAKVNRVLGETFPDARCELDFESPLQLLVATVLSAQCTDKRVNQVTPLLFRELPDAAALAAAPRSQVEDLIKSTGFYRNKAAAIQGLAAAILARHGGEVPATLADLVTLPGVGRKTANVVLGNAFGIPGVTVDTHVGRIARRLGWTTQTDPVKVETDLMALFPDSEWVMLNHRLIFLGRRICHARKPACGACPLAALCPSFGQGPTDPDAAARLVRTQ